MESSYLRFLSQRQRNNWLKEQTALAQERKRDQTDYPRQKALGHLPADSHRIKPGILASAAARCPIDSGVHPPGELAVGHGWRGVA